MRNRWLSILCTFLFMLLVVLPSQGHAEMIDFFSRVTNNSPEDLAGQFTVEITSPSDGMVTFHFENAVGIASSIADIYFYDGTFIDADTMSVASSAGVSFASPADPAKLPGYSGFPTAIASADSDSPIAPNGINTSTEWLDLTFALLDGQSVDTIVDALHDQTFVIGLHVQAIGALGDSDGYVTPVPGAVLLGVLGLGWAGMKLRKLV